MFHRTAATPHNLRWSSGHTLPVALPSLSYYVFSCFFSLLSIGYTAPHIRLLYILIYIYAMFLLSYITCTTVNMWSTSKYYSCRPIMHTCKRGMLHTLINIPLIYYILPRYTSICLVFHNALTHLHRQQCCLMGFLCHSCATFRIHMKWDFW